MAATLAAEFLHALLRVNLAAGGAILLVLLLRKIVRPRFGARLGYSLWLLPILAALAVLVPARQVLVAAPVLPAGLPSAAPSVAALSLETLPATVAGTLTAAPIETGASLDLNLLILALWFAGAVGAGLVMIALQRRFVAEMKGGGIGPAVVGVIRPRIVTPKDFAEKFSGEEQALVLAHEGVHIERQDSRINGLSAAIQCLCWFNPLVHLGARLMRVDQEMACDEVVVARFPDARRAYAQALVKGQLAVRPLPLGCYWPSSGAHPLYARIAMLKAADISPARRRVGGAALAGLCAGAGVAAWAAQPADVRMVRLRSASTAPPAVAAPTPVQAVIPASQLAATGQFQLAMATPAPSTRTNGLFGAPEVKERIVSLQAVGPIVVSSAESVIDFAKADLSPLPQLASFAPPTSAGRAEVAPVVARQRKDAPASGTTRIADDKVQIVPADDTPAGRDVTQQAALAWAAETTLAAGYDHFRFSPDGTWAGPAYYGYKAGDRCRRLECERLTDLGRAYSMPVVKPGQPLTITMSKGARPDRIPDGMFEARDVLARLARLRPTVNVPPADGRDLVEQRPTTPYEMGFRTTNDGLPLMPSPPR